MAADVTVHGFGSDVAPDAVGDALACFTEVDRTCTRFDPNSALMRANARPSQWHDVPGTLFEAVREAHRAYQHTGGLFDPRVIGTLIALGYDHSLAFEAGSVVTRGAGAARPTRPSRPWRPRFRGGPRPHLHLDGQPVELGGIGKGLALRWGAERLAGRVHDFLIDAGGDCICAGRGPDGEGWRIGIEDPAGSTEPLAVVELRDLACATSSVRLRSWRSAGRTVHHLIDPRTGRPGGAGLRSVTVLAPDPADAEVASKTLFLRGRRSIGPAARRAGRLAFWVCTDGTTGETARFTERVIWRQP
jgi:thiamine biosynthesis lipoprotein